MLPKSILAVLLLAVLARAAVVDLDDSNFTSFLAQQPYTLVEFYAPWCGHCKSLAPEYEKLGQLAEGKQFAIAKVDATAATKSAGEYEVEGYPTIKFLANGFPIDYKGGRTADDMLEWLESFFTSKIEGLTEEQVKEKIGSEDFLLVQGASAEQLQTLEVANFVDEAIKYYSLAEGEYRVTLHLKKDSKALDFAGELSVKDLTAWTLQNSLPVVVPLNSEAQTRVVFENQEKLPAFLLYKTEDFSVESFSKLEGVCEANKAVFKCSYADSKSSLFAGVARYLHVTEPDTSLLAYVKYGLKQGYKFPNLNDISSESVSQFLQDVNEGKLQRYIDTEKDKKDKEIKYVNVLKLTAENYNQTLADNRYVFVEYYSPNCGHCVRFAPEYEKLATKVKEEGLGFVVAAADLVGESQIAQWVDVSGYPTLRFYINGKSIDYSGERNGEAVIKFVKEAMNSKLQVVASADEVTVPAVILGGVADDSDLHLLPALFTRYPAYLVAGADFKVQVRTKKGVKVYSGEAVLDQVVAWLDDVTEPIVVAVVDSKPTKRLSKALDGKAPLLVITRREQVVSGYVLDVLEQYCQGKDDIVCGYAAKEDQDYESFNGWLGDKQEDKSVLVYVDTTEFKKTIYEGDLAALTPEDISAFIEQASKKEAAAEETAPAGEASEEVPEAVQEEVAEAVPEETGEGAAEEKVPSEEL